MTNVVPRPDPGPLRRAHVLARLHEVSVLSVTDLARELGVSPMTVRRDLHRLEADGQVRTVHGGVGLAGSTQGDGGREAEGHRRVARRAVQLVGPEDVIVVDGGPSAHELARMLPDCFRGSVITHSMSVMQVLAERAGLPDGPRLVALGGELVHARQVLVGPSTLEAAAALRARTFFLDPSAVDVRGTYAGSTAEAGVARGLAGIADDVVLLATRESFAGSAPALVTRLDRLATVVADGRPPGDVCAALAAADVDLVVAG